MAILSRAAGAGKLGPAAVLPVCVPGHGQNNPNAHDNAEPHTQLGRGLLCLYAAALLWPDMTGSNQ
jgi:hypothetical protein